MRRFARETRFFCCLPDHLLVGSFNPSLPTGRMRRLKLAPMFPSVRRMGTDHSNPQAVPGMRYNGNVLRFSGERIKPPGLLRHHLYPGAARARTRRMRGVSSAESSQGTVTLSVGWPKTQVGLGQSQTQRIIAGPPSQGLPEGLNRILSRRAIADR